MNDPKHKCVSCASEFASSSGFCQSCGCPDNCNDILAQSWFRSFTEPPKKPSWWDKFDAVIYGPRIPVYISKCPNCRKYMFIYDSLCPNCNYKLRLTERHKLFQNYNEKYDAIKSRENFYALLGIIFLIVIFFLYAIYNF